MILCYGDSRCLICSLLNLNLHQQTQVLLFAIICYHLFSSPIICNYCSYLLLLFFFGNFWTIICYFFSLSKNTIFAIIWTLLFELFLLRFYSFNYWHYSLLFTIISIICSQFCYLDHLKWSFIILIIWKEYILFRLCRLVATIIWYCRYYVLSHLLFS